MALALLIATVAIGQSPALADSDGKMPLTTNSKSALENYNKGEALTDNLRGAEAGEFYQTSDPGRRE